MARTRLETFANIAVIAAAAIFIGTNAYNYYRSKAPTPLPERLRQLVGKRLPLPSALEKGRSGTITLFVSKDCHFCTESMSFYQKLADAKLQSGCDIRLDVVGSKDIQTREELQGYVAQHNLRVNSIDVADFRDLNIAGTPTVTVQDSTMIVRDVWFGKLRGNQENEVFSKIQSLCRN